MPHLFEGDRGGEQIAAVGGEEHALADRIQPVSGAPETLQAGGDRRGHPTCTIRSMLPMSMPNSRLLVATTAGSFPDFKSSSIPARSDLLTEP